MKEKFSNLIYPSVIVISFLMSLAALCRTYNRTLGFDYIGIIVGILALLVTALIGWQVLQAILVEDKIKQIAKDTSSTIAKEKAEEVSKSVSIEIANKTAKDANDIARKTAEKAIKDLAKDTTIIAHGKEKMKNVPNLMMFGEYIKSIDDIIEAINIFKTCSYSTISEPVIEDALLSLDKVFEDCLKQEVPRYLEDKRDYYISVLEDVHNSRIEKCISYLQYAKGYPASIDYDIREAKDKKELEAKLRGGKSD